MGPGPSRESQTQSLLSGSREPAIGLLPRRPGSGVMPNRTMRASALALAAAAGLSGCATIGTPFQAPDVSVPAAWRTAPALPSASLSADWWRGFDSQQLAELVAEAEVGNLDLAA